MTTTNYELERQIAVCKEAIEEAKKHRDDFNTKYNSLQDQITAKTTEKQVLVDKGYGVNDSRRAKFTGCTDGGISGRNSGCLTGGYHNGGNVIDDNGYYLRRRKEWMRVCGPETRCESGDFDGTICHDKVLDGCITTFKDEKNWDYLEKTDITYTSEVQKNTECYSGTIWKPVAYEHTPKCKKTASRITQERSVLAQKQTEIDSLTTQINNLEPPTINFDCRICNSANTITCSLGATCTEITQANTCIQTIEDAYADCKSKGGIYDSVANKCNLPVNCEVSPWSSWSACSVKCGSGVQTRERSIIKTSAYGGTVCPTNLKESQPCQDNTQCPVNCEVTWKPEGVCSATCGIGNQKYVGTITKQPQFNGTDCPTTLVKNERCENYTGCIVGTTPSTTPSTTPKLNIDTTPKMNVDTAPKLNVDTTPKLNVDTAPKLNVDTTHTNEQDETISDTLYLIIIIVVFVIPMFYLAKKIIFSA